MSYRDLPVNGFNVKAVLLTVALCAIAACASQESNERKAKLYAETFVRVEGIYCDRSLIVRSALKTIMDETLTPNELRIDCPIDSIHLESAEPIAVLLPSSVRDGLRIGVAYYCNSVLMRGLIREYYLSISPDPKVSIICEQ